MKENVLKMFLNLNSDINISKENVNLLLGMCRFYKNEKQMYVVEYNGRLSFGYVYETSESGIKTNTFESISREKALDLFPKLIYIINLLD